MQVLITGGTGGIGFAIASQFAAEGHSVVIADLQQDAIDSKVAQLRQQGYQAEGIVLDVTDAASITRCAQTFPAEVSCPGCRSLHESARGAFADPASAKCV